MSAFPVCADLAIKIVALLTLVVSLISFIIKRNVENVRQAERDELIKQRTIVEIENKKLQKKIANEEAEQSDKSDISESSFSWPMMIFLTAVIAVTVVFFTSRNMVVTTQKGIPKELIGVITYVPNSGTRHRKDDMMIFHSDKRVTEFVGDVKMEYFWHTNGSEICFHAMRDRKYLNDCATISKKGDLYFIVYRDRDYSTSLSIIKN